MSISEIVRLQKERGKNFECFGEIVDTQYEVLDRALAQMLLVHVSDMEFTLEKWLQKTKESVWYEKMLETMTKEEFDQNIVINIQKVSSSSNDLAYLGHWSLNYYLANKKESNKKIRQTGDLEYSLSEAMSIVSTNEFNFRTNEDNSGSAKFFQIPINDFSKLYDFFIPEKYLKEYNATKLSQDLDNENESKNTKRKIKL